MYRNLSLVKKTLEGFDFLRKHEVEKIYSLYVENLDEYVLEQKEFIFDFDCDKIYSAQRPRKGRVGIYAPDAKNKNLITKEIKRILEEEYDNEEIPKYNKIRVEITANFREVVKNKFERVLIRLGLYNVFKKPDVDNIAKIHLDACNGILWEDDAHITELLVVKQYNANNPNQDNIKIRVIYN